MAAGVGLGLAVVKLNTDLLGGTLNVKNKTGGGLRFEIEIPDRSDVSDSKPTAEEFSTVQPV